MLAKYARAVGLMNSTATPESSPRSWRFQWYIHATPVDRNAELNRVFGGGKPDLRSLADDVWSTCQTHFGGDGDMFLPWHRMYVMAFESIVRTVLADDNFTIPYWDYTQAGKRSIPIAFRQANDPVFGNLFRPNRNIGNTDINAGDPMDKGMTQSPYTLATMGLPTYSSRQGFCTQLDRTLHGNVHVGIGDETNMGDVPTAAGDPIFWLHHCNIDRIWAGWNKAGGVNPTKSSKFIFASPDPAGKRTVMDTAMVGDVMALGYQYDSLPVPPPKPVSASAAGGAPRTVAVSTQPIRLGSGPTRVTLSSPAVDGAISSSVSTATATGRIFLVFSALSSNVQPGTLYEAFVNLPSMPSESDKREHYVGSISFFGLSGEHVHADGGGPTFEVTERFKLLREANKLGANADITLIPVGDVRSAAAPLVGSIEIVRQ